MTKTYGKWDWKSKESLNDNNSKNKNDENIQRPYMEYGRSKESVGDGE